jgi:putative protease
MLSHLDKLKAAGVSSFKIEGRMKSEYYLATVINAYRRALDGANLADMEKERCAVAHRDYTTAYTLGENKETVNYTDGQDKGDYDYIANVHGSENGFIIAEMRNRFKLGDTLEILSPNETHGKRFCVEEIYDSKGVSTTDAKLVQELYKIKCPYELRAGDILRKKRV